MYQLVIYRKSDGAIQRVVSRAQTPTTSLVSFGFNPVLFDSCKVISRERIVPNKWKVKDGKLTPLISKQEELLREFKPQSKENLEGYSLVFVGDPASAKTGFGTQYKILKEGLERRGYKIQQVRYQNIPQLVDMDCDFVFALSDFGSVRAIFDLDLSNLVYWFALESPDWPAEWNKHLKKVKTIVPLTKYGQRALLEKDVRCEQPIPHGVDPEIFKPTPIRQRGLLRLQNEVDNKFVISYLGTNAKRKRLDLLVRSYAKFVNNYDKEKRSVLLLKTKENGHYDIENVILTIAEEQKNPSLRDQIRVIEKEMSEQEVNQFINISDVGFNATSGEGFCVPTIEYLMCGVPFIAGRHTSFPELLGRNLPLVSVEDMEIDSRFKWTRYNIDTDHAAEILSEYFENWSKRKVYDRQKLREIALNYTSDMMVNQWDKSFREFERKQVEEQYIKKASTTLLQIGSSEDQQKIYEKAAQAVDNVPPEQTSSIRWIKVF